MVNPVKAVTMVLRNVKMAGTAVMVSVISIMVTAETAVMVGMVKIHPLMELRAVMVVMVVPVVQHQILREPMEVKEEMGGMAHPVAMAVTVPTDK
ncbi:hypothetical protein DSF71_13620 [Salmonella enterica subsp. enterica serovar Hvittingfoss]|nr:hypothetical protein [Salmonella enterica subsp. enterica serovar Hvittingfoss]